MKSIVVLTYFLIFLCFKESDCGPVKDFFSLVSHDLESAFNAAWSKISTVIKQPVRIQRLGNGGRKKRTTPHSRTSEMTLPPDATPFAIYLFSKRTRPTAARPTLPVFTMPAYESQVEWHKQQIPLQLWPVQGINDKPNPKPDYSKTSPTAVERTTKQSDDTQQRRLRNKAFKSSGVLFFV